MVFRENVFLRIYCKFLQIWQNTVFIISKKRNFKCDNFPNVSISFEFVFFKLYCSLVSLYWFLRSDYVVMFWIFEKFSNFLFTLSHHRSPLSVSKNSASKSESLTWNSIKRFYKWFLPLKYVGKNQWPWINLKTNSKKYGLF